MDTPKYLSLRDLSKHSSLSVKTLRHFLHAPDSPLPHYRMPRKILIDVQEFDAWFRRFRVENPGLDLNQLVNEIMSEISCGPAQNDIRKHS